MIKILAWLLTLFVLNFAQASLISTDWNTSGDNLLTLDDATGLEWLDWSHTQNRSYADVSSKFGIGDEFEGFRYATFDELIGLYTNVGFIIPTLSDASNIPLAQDYTSLFGITFGSNPPENGGVEAWYDHSTASGQHWVTAINHSDGLVQPEWFQDNDSSTYSYVGSALVRSSTVIPEPTSIALLGLGLAGIGFSRKKKTA